MEIGIIGSFITLLSIILVWLYRRSYKIQDKKLNGIENQLNTFGKLLLFLKIQNIAQNTALQKEFNDGFSKIYDIELKKLMAQENFKKV